MNYDQIKAELANARSFLDSGNVPEAHRIIVAASKKGMSLNDLDNGLTKNQMRQLREYQAGLATPKVVRGRIVR
jgi:hypothetical protein